MKKIIYIIMLVVVFFSACKKDMPKLDNAEQPACYGCNPLYSAYYILKNINATLINDDTLHNDDTLIYNKFHIALRLNGFVISEQTYEYWKPNGNPSLPQSYFVNKIKDYKIYANGVNINSGIKILKRDKIGKYYESNLINEKIGYTPLKIKLTDTNVLGRTVFKIEITDDKDNIFTAETDSVYISK